MQGFEDVTLGWKGIDYVIPATKQLMLIQKIEDALSGDTGEQAVSVLFRKGGVPHSRLARAYGAALRHAGAKVTDEEVYLSIHQDIAEKSAQQVEATMLALIWSLLAIISPPTVKTAREQAEAMQAPKKARPAKASSEPST